MKLRSKIITAAAVSSTVLIGGAAYAFFTTTGGGTGSATAGSSSPVTIVLADPVAAVVPGGPAASVNLQVNNSTAGQVINFVRVQIDSDAMTGPCAPTNFTIDNPYFAVTAPLIAGPNIFRAPTDAVPSLRMINAAVNQDVCQGVSVPLKFTVTTTNA